MLPVAFTSVAFLQFLFDVWFFLKLYFDEIVSH